MKVEAGPIEMPVSQILAPLEHPQVGDRPPGKTRRFCHELGGSKVACSVVVERVVSVSTLSLRPYF